MAKRIAGIALFPRESLNGVFYHEEELRKFDDLVVPLRFNHNPEPDGVIGEVKFTFDETKKQVLYDAQIFNEEIQELVDRVNFQVSIGATPEENREDHQMCDKTGRKCLDAPVLQSIDELSIVATPGIPETTLNVLETGATSSGSIIPIYNFTTTGVNFQSEIPQHERMKCGGIKKDCAKDIYTSIKPNPKKKESMAEETSKPDKVEEKVKVTIETDDKIEVADAKSEEAPAKEEEAKETPKKEEKVVKEESPKTDTEEIEKKVTESATKEVKNLLEEVRSNWQPKSEIQESSTSNETWMEKEITDEEARKIVEKLDTSGYVKLKIDKEDWIAHNTYNQSKGGKITEAVATSGTIPTVVADNQVVIDKSGKSELSLRQWGKFKAIPTGANTARFYRVTVPDAGAITESPTTDITASTHTLTSVDVTCSPRGWRQTVEKSEFEDYPAALLNAIKETARVEAIRDEHRLIVQTLASTDNDFGGTSTEPYHISADDGLAITTTTLEDAAAQLAPDGLSLAKQHLQTIHDPSIGPNALVAFLAPIAFENLYTHTNLSEYTMVGSPSVTRTGMLEKIYGIDIVITNELLVQNNAFRNLLCVKGKAWALASQRGMSIELQNQIAGQYTDIVWTHRIGVDEIDHSAYVIISGPNS